MIIDVDWWSNTLWIVVHFNSSVSSKLPVNHQSIYNSGLSAKFYIYIMSTKFLCLFPWTRPIYSVNNHPIGNSSSRGSSGLEQGLLQCRLTPAEDVLFWRRSVEESHLQTNNVRVSTKYARHLLTNHSGDVAVILNKNIQKRANMSCNVENWIADGFSQSHGGRLRLLFAVFQWIKNTPVMKNFHNMRKLTKFNQLSARETAQQHSHVYFTVCEGLRRCTYKY